MDEHIENIISLLETAIETEDWELVADAKNLLENDDFDNFIDDPLEGPDNLAF
tara:strand:- start:419 stop:577 length:159 start_codon:yes stop_codon:yes gene_type:complete